MSTTNYPAWLASLTYEQRTIWEVALNGAPEGIVKDWAEEHNGQRWYAELVVNGSIQCRATQYQWWDTLGMDTILTNGHMEFVNQELDGFDTYRGEWYIADDDTLTIIHGTFGNYNSPGASDYTYGTVYATISGYHDALAEWDGKPEYLQVEDDWEDVTDGPENMVGEEDNYPMM